MLDQTKRQLERISILLGVTVSWLLLLMMLVTTLIVVLRYFFNTGYIAMQESVVYLHGLVFMLGIPYALSKDAHVRVDIFYQSYRPRIRALVNLLGTLLFLLPMVVFITWASLEYVRFSWSVMEGSPEPGGLPLVFALKTLIPISMVALGLQGIAECCRNLLIILARDDHDPHATGQQAKGS